MNLNPWIKSLQVLTLLLFATAFTYGQPLEKGEKVKPYEFGFTIDTVSKQHRHEKRDERGIVMGEFGFITADGIYHVTVYATDEEGKFRILAMRSFPYESPPKTIEMIATPKKSIVPTTTTTTPRSFTDKKPLPKHNFNTRACSGCSIKNGIGKETPSDSNVTPNGGENTQSLNTKTSSQAPNVGLRPVLQPPTVSNTIQGIVKKIMKMLEVQNERTQIATQKPLLKVKAPQNLITTTQISIGDTQSAQPVTTTPTQNIISTKAQMILVGAKKDLPLQATRKALETTTSTQNLISTTPKSVPQNVQFFTTQKPFEISAPTQHLIPTTTQSKTEGTENVKPSTAIKTVLNINAPTQNFIPITTQMRTEDVQNIQLPTITLNPLQTTTLGQNIGSSTADLRNVGPENVQSFTPKKALDKSPITQNLIPTTQSRTEGTENVRSSTTTKIALDIKIPTQSFIPLTTQMRTEDVQNIQLPTITQSPLQTTTLGPNIVSSMTDLRKVDPQNTQSFTPVKTLDKTPITQNLIPTTTQSRTGGTENVRSSTATRMELDAKIPTQNFVPTTTQIRTEIVDNVQPPVVTPAENLFSATKQSKKLGDKNVQPFIATQALLEAQRPSQNFIHTAEKTRFGEVQNVQLSKPRDILEKTTLPQKLIPTTTKLMTKDTQFVQPSTTTQQLLKSQNLTPTTIQIGMEDLKNAQPISTTPTDTKPQIGVLGVSNVQPSVISQNIDQKTINLKRPSDQNVKPLSNTGKTTTETTTPPQKLSASTTHLKTAGEENIESSTKQHPLESITSTPNRTPTATQASTVGELSVPSFSVTQDPLKAKTTLNSFPSNAQFTPTNTKIPTIKTPPEIIANTIRTAQTLSPSPPGTKAYTPTKPNILQQTPQINTITNSNPAVSNSNEAAQPVLTSTTKTSSAPSSGIVPRITTSTVNANAFGTPTRAGVSTSPNASPINNAPEVDLRISGNAITPQKPSVNGAQNRAVQQAGTVGSSSGSATNNALPVGFAQRIGEEIVASLSGPSKAGGKSSPTAAGVDGDLYHFKYLLDYNGHEETGARNGNKVGNFFSIGDDNVERTIEYIANEFGYQPRIRWRKLDANRERPAENALKEYEFVWFRKD